MCVRSPPDTINGVSATGQTRRNRRNTSQFIGSGQAEDRAMHASDVLAGAADRSQPAPQGGAVVLKATIRHDTEENAKVSVCRSAHDFRSSLGSGHRHGRSACLKSANSGSRGRGLYQITYAREMSIARTRGETARHSGSPALRRPSIYI
jgi:hypothetical protein